MAVPDMYMLLAMMTGTDLEGLIPRGLKGLSKSEWWKPPALCLYGWASPLVSVQYFGHQRRPSPRSAPASRRSCMCCHECLGRGSTAAGRHLNSLLAG